MGLERDTTEDVGGETLLSVWLLEGLVPVERGELEDATGGPAGDEAEEVAQVAQRLDAVELAAGEQRHEGRVDLGGLVIADEEPVLATDHLAAQRLLADVVADGQARVVEK